ncbi:MAG: dihydrofolate reductase family protein [Chloroflexota bacterium]
MSGDRPFVILNTAVTADGKIDTIARQGAVISSASDWERVDRLRAESDAIMVGGRTLLGEDPRLLVKSPSLREERLARGLEENPIKVGILTKIDDPADGPTLHVGSRFVTAGPARRVIFTSGLSSAEQIERLRKLGVEVLVAGERRVDLAEALRRLVSMGVKKLLVEGGSTLNAELLRQRLIDEIYLYVAPLIFEGASAPTLADGPGLQRNEAIRLRLLDVEKMEDGAVLLHYALRDTET